MIDWLFRDRTTGKIVIGQFPNTALWIFLAATAIRLLFHPKGTYGTAVLVAATGGLLWWAGDELLRGVNPWRRMLGVVVGATVAGLLWR